MSIRIRQTLNSLAIASLAVAAGLSSCTKAGSGDTATAQFAGTWNGSGCVTQAAKWTQKAPTLSTGRQGAVSFSINNLVYLGGGVNKKDFWVYNPAANNWAILPDIPGETRNRGFGVGFAINDKGYIGLGKDTAKEDLRNNLYQYDPTTNVWTAMSPMPTASRYGAFCFVINGVAYIGGGYDSTGTWLKDMWSYEPPPQDRWIRKADVPQYLFAPFAFAIGDSGYVSCGKQAYHEDTATWMYYPGNDTWTRKAGYAGPKRQGGSSFVLNKIAYCGLGTTYGAVENYDDFYTYDPTANRWRTLGVFPGSSNCYATAATTSDGKAYVGTGLGIYPAGPAQTYWFEYQPVQNTQSFTISSGSNNFSLNMTYRIGKGDTCYRDVTLKGTVSSNAMNNFSIANQTFTDRCGKTYTISGGGSLINDTLIVTTVSASSEGTSACTFRGIK